METYILTKDQQKAFDDVKQFLRVDDEEPVIVIKGTAGTGKTFLCRHIVNYAQEIANLSVVAVAPTHKARRVLEKMLNKDRLFQVATATVASILGKMREHSYIGTHKYKSGSKQKMDQYQLIILDEVSMVSDKDLDEILDYICETEKKIILIGDDCQIPSPSQHLVKKKHACFKPDSSAFQIVPLCHLQEIVRQAADSPIIQLATYLRDNIKRENTLQDILTGSGVGDILSIELGDLYDQVVKDIRAGIDTRVIAYTNAAVRTHNTQIRKRLGYEDPFVEGDLLTGYNNVGFPNPVIENGTDYRILALRYTDRHQIKEYTGLCGYLIDLQDIDNKANLSRRLFFISPSNSGNQKFMSTLISRAEKVNNHRSTKDDFRKYIQLKNQTIFLEDIYKFDKDIMTETNFKQFHPLLFTKISEVIDVEDKSLIKSELSEKIEETYGENVISRRMNDNKPFSDNETLADKYMVVEKDVYYGFSNTSHKAQGSTYKHVYVDQKDFEKLSNKWNYRFGAMENRYKEKNQLMYVAYTRASDQLRIVV